MVALVGAGGAGALLRWAAADGMATWTNMTKMSYPTILWNLDSFISGKLDVTSARAKSINFNHRA
jgi:hypothetical protein